MARRKRTKGEKPDEAQQLPISYAPEAHTDELHLYPFELRAGDLVTDERGNGREIVGHPSAYNQGKMHRVRMQKPGDPSVMNIEYWPAHERVAVRREQR
jgi:hypothetical protein